MKKIINKILYYIISGVWYGLSLLPLRLLYVISDLMFLILADFIRYRRRTILKNLHDSFPEKDEKEIIIIMLKFYHRFCDYIVETVKLMSMSKKQAMRRIKFEGVEEMNQVLEQGQSVALLLSHTFNWELISTIPYWVDKEVVCGEISGKPNIRPANTSNEGKKQCRRSAYERHTPTNNIMATTRETPHNGISLRPKTNVAKYPPLG